MLLSPNVRRIKIGGFIINIVRIISALKHKIKLYFHVIRVIYCTNNFILRLKTFCHAFSDRLWCWQTISSSVFSFAALALWNTMTILKQYRFRFSKYAFNLAKWYSCQISVYIHFVVFPHCFCIETLFFQ